MHPYADAGRASRRGKRAAAVLREGVEEARHHFNELGAPKQTPLVECGRMKAPARLRLAEEGALKGVREDPLRDRGKPGRRPVVGSCPAAACGNVLRTMRKLASGERL